MLRWIVLAVLASVTAGGLSILLWGPSHRPLLVFHGVVLFAALATLALLRLDRSRLAGIFFTTACWIILAVAVLTLGGTNSPAYFAYVAVVFVAGTFLGSRAAIALAVLSILFGLSVVWAEQQGWIGSPWVSPAPIRRWYALSVEVLVAAIFVCLARRSIETALGEARASEATALASSREAQQRQREHAAVAQLATRAVLGRGEEFLSACLEVAREVVGADSAHVLERSGSREYRTLASTGDLVPPTLSHWVFQNDEAVWFEDPAEPDRSEGIAALRAAGVGSGGAVPIPAPDGVERWLCAYCRSSLAMGAARVDILRSVASLVAATWERESLEEQLRTAHKLEAVGRLAAGVAHDFNNLLAVVVGNTELLRSQHPKLAQLAPIEAILEAAFRGKTLTSQLLSFSRAEGHEPSDCDPNASAIRLQGMAEVLLDEEVELELDLEPEPWSIRANPGHVDQLLLNLVLNARDATPRGGAVVIRTRNVPAKKALQLGPEVAPLPHVKFTVEDRGTGMDRDTRLRILEPFFTTKEPGKGTGLGLSIVYGIVKQHGGELRIQSRPGRGTRVDIYVPASVSSEHQGSTRITTGPTPASTRPSRRASPNERSTLRPAT